MVAVNVIHACTFMSATYYRQAGLRKMNVVVVDWMDTLDAIQFFLKFMENDA